MASFMKRLKSMIHPQKETQAPIEDIPENVALEINNINNAVEHVMGCDNFPCETCVRGMSLVKEISGNSALDQVAIGDLMAQRTNFARMFVSTWEKQHLLELFSKSSEQLSNRGQRSFEFYRALAGTAWNYTDESADFCQALEGQECLRSLVDWLMVTANAGNVNKWTTELEFNTLNIFHNVCCKHPDIARNYRRVVPALEILGESKDAITQICAYMTLSYLVKKDEADKLTINEPCVETLLSLLTDAMKSLEHKTRINRPTATDAFRRGFTLSAVELVRAVEQLAINDANKELIAEKGGIPLFGRMLEMDCTVKEKTHAAEGLWSLAFIQQNKETIREEQDIIKELIAGANCDKPALRTASMGALFQIYDSRLPQDAAPKPEAPKDEAKRESKPDVPDVLNGATAPEEDSTERGRSTQQQSLQDPRRRIMISYKWESPSKEVMREIKDQLKSRGFNVWMDEEFMSGDMLHAMTSAVENSTLILACISEGYQESKNCRTEATYAYDCNKKIVPVKVSDNFRATGWLGGLTAGKIYYVIKNPNDVARELPRIIDLEIEENHEKSEKISKVNEGGVEQPSASAESGSGVEKPEAAPSPGEDVSGWDNKRVREWLKENGISTRNKGLKNLKGGQVLQLKKQLAAAPQSFYQCMKEDMKVNYTDVLSLAEALEKL